jgi:hypothetical protein
VAGQPGLSDRARKAAIGLDRLDWIANGAIQPNDPGKPQLSRNIQKVKSSHQGKNRRQEQASYTFLSTVFSQPMAECSVV